jgi:hypothetical protein
LRSEVIVAIGDLLLTSRCVRWSMMSVSPPFGFMCSYCICLLVRACARVRAWFGCDGCVVGVAGTEPHGLPEKMKMLGPNAPTKVPQVQCGLLPVCKGQNIAIRRVYSAMIPCLCACTEIHINCAYPRHTHTHTQYVLETLAANRAAESKEWREYAGRVKVVDQSISRSRLGAFLSNFTHDFVPQMSCLKRTRFSLQGCGRWEGADDGECARHGETAAAQARW